MIYFLAPFYNEEEFLPKFLKNLTKTAQKLKIAYKIILVDDGSRDKSVDIIGKFKEKFPIEVISFKHNKGVHAAFKVGFEFVFKTGKDNDIIVTLESDNTSDLEILPRMIREIMNGHDFVLASCYAEGGQVYGTGIFRQVTSKVANLLLYLFFPIKGVKTYSSFYRAYKLKTLKRAWKVYNGKLIYHRGFVCMAEMLIKLSKLPVRIVEVPMILKWEGRRGKSKMKIGKTILGYWFLFKDLYLKNFLTKNSLEKIKEKWQNSD